MRTPFKPQETLYEALLTAADKHGRQQPIIRDSETEPVTYGQFILRSQVLAQVFAKELQDEEYVGLMLPNALATPLAFFALQSLCKVPAMLNYTAGLPQLQSACKTAKLKTVITSKLFIRKAELEPLVDGLKSQVRFLYLEDVRKKISFFTKIKAYFAARKQTTDWRKAHQESRENDPAVVLFTSGSEGLPKGVVLSHRNLMENLRQITTILPLSDKERLFSPLPLFHSFGFTCGTLLPMLHGIETYLYVSPLHYQTIPGLIRDYGATLLFATNTFLSGYARYAGKDDLQSLKLVVAGGEKLRDYTRMLWDDQFGITVYEGYGVTETSPALSVNVPGAYKHCTVGHLLPDIEFALRPIDGMNGGVLEVRGPNIMKGYLLADKPGELQPPSTEQGKGWYDTGDVVQVDEDGYITIIDRVKRFAKLGGEMVSLAAIEDFVEEYWGDLMHAVVSVPDKNRGEKLVLVTQDAAITMEALRNAAKCESIPPLWVPKHVVVVDDMPLLSTGKPNYPAITAIAEESVRDTSRVSA